MHNADIIHILCLCFSNNDGFFGIHIGVIRIKSDRREKGAEGEIPRDRQTEGEWEEEERGTARTRRTSPGSLVAGHGAEKTDELTRAEPDNETTTSPAFSTRFRGGQMSDRHVRRKI
ncbi:hypothetical protein FQA47_015189 [Oryzias melastigma]|uniref:Uncharacterized protein n=1 Tax=Oryzias melastigma TaxID=30732 RepID=A0A834EZ66_ORYME|nr:hypothetical protein FQA47_015189 [Oryzias melastigma]